VKFTSNRDDRIEAIHFGIGKSIRVTSGRSVRNSLIASRPFEASAIMFISGLIGQGPGDVQAEQRMVVHGHRPNQGAVPAHDLIAVSFPEDFSDNFSSSGPASANKILRKPLVARRCTRTPLLLTTSQY
jgi:hypothetical protein